ncbi:translocation/assembly module TamB domain-containing protein [Blattabacterium cuenoti]|uniref:translocation/assembly module TamB domain-containing protein n=1 Tax=Blattabacterium cuenoti TaxID=1653831 RepID=UPI001EEC1676|nr:translocation/assembly module TamB domain-containing protein [Blattabacterium cuenoti]
MVKSIDDTIIVKTIDINILKKEFIFYDVKIMDHHSSSLIYIPKCKISIKSFLKFFFQSSKSIDINNILIKNPIIFIRKYLNEKENNLFFFLRNFFFQKKKLREKYVKTINCSNIEIKNAFFTYKNFSSKKIYSYSFSTFVKNIRIDRNRKKEIEASISSFKPNKRIKKNFFHIKNFFCHFIFSPSKLKFHNFFIKTSNSFLSGKVIFYNSENGSFLEKKNMNICGEIFKGSKLGEDMISFFWKKKTNHSDRPNYFLVHGFINGKLNEKISLSKIGIKNSFFKKVLAEKIDIFYDTKKKWKKIQFFRVKFQTCIQVIQKIFPSYSILKFFPFRKSFFSYNGNLTVKKKWIKINGNIKYKTSKVKLEAFIISNNKNKSIEYRGKFFTKKNFIFSGKKDTFYSLIQSKIPDFSSKLFVFNFKGIFYKTNYIKKIKKNEINRFLISLFFPYSGVKINFNGKINNITGFKNFSINVLNKKICNMIIGNIYGNFKWNNLLYFFKKNFLSFIDEKKSKIHFPISISKNEYVFFNFSIKKAFFKLFHPNKKIKILSDVLIIGLYKNSFFNMNFFVKEKIQLNETLIESIRLKINNHKVEFFIRRINFENVLFQNLNSLVLNKKNYLWINLNFFHKFKKEELNFIFKKNDHSKKKNNFIVLFPLHSKLEINGNNWNIINQIDKNIGKIKLDFINRKYIFENIIFSSNEKKEKLIINANFYKKHYRKFNLFLKNVELKKITLAKNFIIEGSVNGSFIFEINKNRNIIPNYVNILIKKVSIKKTIIGNFYIHSFPNSSKLYGILEKNSSKIIFISGYINRKSTININLNIKIIKLNISDISFLWEKTNCIPRGIISGKIQLYGKLDNPHLYGTLKVDKFGIKLNSINTDYEIISPIYLKIIRKYCLLSNSFFIDKKYHTKGNIKGIFCHKNLLKWNFHLLIKSKKLLVLNTKKKQNVFLFGKIFSQGEMKIIKNENHINICMDKGNILNSSHLYFNTEGLKKDKKIVEKNQKIIDSEKKNENDKNLFFIDIKTHINENTKISILLDEKIGNFIELRGRKNGFIFLKKVPNQKLKTSGKYFIKDGLYYFSNQKKTPIFKIEKKFKIKPGGFITWTDNFSYSNINLTAFDIKYVSNAMEYLYDINHLMNNNNLMILTELRINIHGDLQNPDVKTDIFFPKSNEELQDKLSYKLRSYKNEKNIQFFSILTIGKFFTKFSSKKDFINLYTYNILLKIIGDYISYYLYPSFHINFGILNNQKEKNLLSSIYYEINDHLFIKNNINLFGNNKGWKKNWISSLIDFQLNLDIHSIENKNLKLIFFSRPNNFFSSKKKTFLSDSSQIYGSRLTYSISLDDLLKFIKKFFFKQKKNIFSK